jgi:hypothetical protein
MEAFERVQAFHALIKLLGYRLFHITKFHGVLPRHVVFNHFVTTSKFRFGPGVAASPT